MELDAPPLAAVTRLPVHLQRLRGFTTCIRKVKGGGSVSSAARGRQEAVAVM